MEVPRVSYVQNYYPLEYRTPPLPLVALIGCPEVHKDVADFFVHQLRPPLVSLFTSTEPTEQFLSRNFGPGKQASSTAPTPSGILKAEWLAKHRGKRPAVAVALITRQELEGDPSSWTRMLYTLKLVRDAAAQRGAGIVVGVVQEHDSGELPPERITGICHNLSLEPRMLLSVVAKLPPGLQQEDLPRMQREVSLRSLGQLVHEQCSLYYQRRAQGVVNKQSERMATAAMDKRHMPVLSARTSIKLAVYAEFRQDWKAAVQEYQAAYGHLKQVTGGRPLSPQTFAEVARVAELVHLKLLMLLLHQTRMDEAVVQAQGHLAFFATPPVSLAPPAAAHHMGFMVRQQQVAAEVVCGKLEAAAASGQPLSPLMREMSRPLLLMTAAELAVRRRKLCDSIRNQAQQQSHQTSLDMAAVRRGMFLGQVALKTSQATLRPMTDLEYLAYLEAEEAPPRVSPAPAAASGPTSSRPSVPTGGVDPAAACVEVLNTALQSLKDTRSSERMRSRLGLMLAQEHVSAGNYTAARKMLLQVCHTYRRDGWDKPLAQALIQLKEVASKLRMPFEHAICTLELAALGAIPGGDDATAAATRMALSTITAGMPDTALRMAGWLGNAAAHQQDKSGSDGSSHDATSTSGSTSPLQRVSPQASFRASLPPSRDNYMVEYLDLREAQRKAREQGGEEVRAADILQRHNQQDFGWWRCVAVALGCVPTSPDPDTVELYVGLHNLLPLPIKLLGATISVSDEQGEVTLVVQPCRRLPDSTPVVTLAQGAGRVGAAGQAEALPVRSEDAACDSVPDRDTTSNSQRQQALGMLDASAIKERSAGQLHTTSSNASTSGVLEPFTLAPKTWAYAGARLAPRVVGRLVVDRVTLHLAEGAKVTYLARSFPPGHVTLGGLQAHVHMPAPFSGLGGVAPLPPHLVVQHLGQLPSVKLSPSPHGLLGEHVYVPITVHVTRELSGAIMEFAVKPAAGMSPADITLTVDDEGRLATLPLDGGGRMSLPTIRARGQHTVRAWVQAKQPGRLTITALVLCPAPVLQTAAIVFDDPFDSKCRLTAEAGVHTLSPPRLVVTEIGVTSITIGQPVMLHVGLKTLQPGSVELMDAKVVANRESGLMPVVDIKQQLQGWPLQLSKGDVQAFVLPICPTRLTEAPVSTGKLLLTWRRPLSEQRGPKQRQAPRPDDLVTSVVPLPKVLVADALLTARSIWPAQVTAGIAFTYSLQMQNFSAQPLELSVSLLEAPGFVLSGERSQAVTVGAKDSTTVMWLLVAHASGHLQLPSARVMAIRHSYALVTQSCNVYVLPF